MLLTTLRILLVSKGELSKFLYGDLFWKSNQLRTNSQQPSDVKFKYIQTSVTQDDSEWFIQTNLLLFRRKL